MQLAWKPPTLEEFLADIERRRSEPVFREFHNAFAFTSYAAETGQENDPAELILARNMALDTTGRYAECTPTMAWNYHFGDSEAYDREIRRQARARNPLGSESSLPPDWPRVNPALVRRLEQIQEASRRAMAEGAPIQASTQEGALQEPSLQSVQHPQRTTAKRASTAWEGLAPKKRQRRK